MKRAKPVQLEGGRKGLARLYGPNLVIVWDGGKATKEGTQDDLDALPDVVKPADLSGFEVTERKPNEGT